MVKISTLIRHGTARHGTARHGTARYHMNTCPIRHSNQICVCVEGGGGCDCLRCLCAYFVIFQHSRYVLSTL